MPIAPVTRLLAVTPASIDTAAQTLSDGGLVAFPTETVYGLGADAANAIAIARLYAAKGRPAFNPLIVHVTDADAARLLGHFDVAAQRLAAKFWPGPLTLVLEKSAHCPVAELATAGLQTIALRVPDHPVARSLLAAFGRPIVAPSANRSGHVSPTLAPHVMADLNGRIDVVLDGGPTMVGVESSIVACLGSPPRLLRPGGLTRAAIEQVLRVPLAENTATTDGEPDPQAPIAPGMLTSHYAPRTPVRLGATSVEPGEVLLAFGPHRPVGAENAARTLNLSPDGDLIEAAANLFAHLRALDGSGATAIAVMPLPTTGLGEAINDRLRRAAADDKRLAP